MNIIRKIITEKNIYKIDPNSKNLIFAHIENIKKKKILRSAFSYFYNEILTLSNNHFSINKNFIELELGSGVGFIKDFKRSIITSDLRSIPNIDKHIDACSMPFDDESVGGIYAINVFHHLDNPDNFFKESYRVLKRGGGIILIEPHGGVLSKLIHKVIHTDEFFDSSVLDWKQNVTGSLSGANQALAEIVFNRDEVKFKEKYANKLVLIKKKYASNFLQYLLSGGLNFKQLCPDFFLPMLIFIEKILNNIFPRFFSLHQIIVIKKL